MWKLFFIASRIVLVTSVMVWIFEFALTFGYLDFLFGVDNKPDLPAYILLPSALLFPLAVVAMLITTRPANVVVKFLKWAIGLTLAVMAIGNVYVFSFIAVPNAGVGGSFAAVLFSGIITGIGLLLMFVELVVLAIAEVFPTTRAE